MLASTATTPLWGKLGDRHGRRALLGVALSLFLIASAACGLAQSLEQLVIARGIQGIAAGGLMSLAMASVGDLVAPRERARWQGRIATVFAGAAVAGPLIGGLLVEHASWRWVFYVNLPVGLAALAGMWRFLPAGTREEHPRPLDLVGAGLLAVASASALLALSWGGETIGWTSPEMVGLVALAVVSGAGFVARERRAADPVVPLAMLATPTVRVAAAGLFLVTASLFAVIVFVPVLLQVSAGFAPDRGRAAARDDDDRAHRRDDDRRAPDRAHRPPAPPAGARRVGDGRRARGPRARRPGRVPRARGRRAGRVRRRLRPDLAAARRRRAERRRAHAHRRGDLDDGVLPRLRRRDRRRRARRRVRRHRPPIADAVQTTLIVAAAIAALAAIVMVALPADVDRDASAS